MSAAVVLVEGMSDKIALEAAAAKEGRDLAEERVTVVAMAGAHAIGGFLRRLVRDQPGTRLAGLCDAGEEDVFRRSLEEAGLGRDMSRTDMERAGFYVCVVDLEDELIRAAGPDRVQDVLESQGELVVFRKFQKQPEWRGRPVAAQLRRFMGNATRKGRYARLLVDALDPESVPRPLRGVLAHVANGSLGAER